MKQANHVMRALVAYGYSPNAAAIGIDAARKGDSWAMDTIKHATECYRNFYRVMRSTSSMAMPKRPPLRRCF